MTYLPFLWRSDAHMFLKPEVTTEFAAWVGHRFADDYEPRLDIGVYESLLDLAGRTAAEIEDLKPRDRIDVQMVASVPSKGVADDRSISFPHPKPRSWLG